MHGPDTVLALLHDAGAFADPALLVDAARREVLLTLRTGEGSRVCSWTRWRGRRTASSCNPRAGPG